MAAGDDDSGYVRRLVQALQVLRGARAIEVRGAWASDDAARIADGHEAVELPEVLYRERDPLFVGEAPHDVRGDRAAEVGVQLGQATFEQLAEIHAASLRSVRASTFPVLAYA